MSEYYQLPGKEVMRKVNGSEEPLTAGQIREHQENTGEMNWRRERRRPFCTFSSDSTRIFS